MKLIILDRDGVINEDSADYVKGPDEWVPIPGSLEAIARLNREGYRVTIATNQAGLAHGVFDIEALNAIHKKFHKLLATYGGSIDGIFFCPHSPDDQCDCRKPLPGLYEQISKRFGCSLQGVPILGDNPQDLEAAIAVQAKPILLRTGKGKNTEQNYSDLGEIPVFDDLKSAVEALIMDETA